MIITKRRLVEEVSENRTIGDYTKWGGLPMADTHEMDKEFFAQATEYVWIDAQNIINRYIRTDNPQVRNKWMFDNDLNATQMKWMEHHWEQFTIATVKERFSDEQVYGMIKSNKLQYGQDYLQLANFLVTECIPKV
jgi:hypothetical protein